MTTMKAYIIDQENRTVHLSEVSKPEIQDGEVLLKNLKWSICRTDVSQVWNELGEKADGKIPGHEIHGVIEESKDSRFKKGDHIVYMGATDFGGGAEYKALRCVLPNDELSGPEHSSTAWFWTDRDFFDVPGAAVVKLNKENQKLLESASLLEPLCCVLRAMENFPPKAGENAIILGAGCIGSIALQCMKNIFGVKDIAVLDVDEKKLAHVKEVYSEYGGSIKTFCLAAGNKNSSVMNKLSNYRSMGISEYQNLVKMINEDLKQLIEDSKGAFGKYLFEALPPLPENEEFPHTRFLGADLLAPLGQYVLFSAEGIEEKTKFFWPILAKGLTLHSTGFDQRCFPMPETAVILQKAYSYVEAGVIDLGKVITSKISFSNQLDVQKAFSNYGKGEFLWKTIVEF